VSSSPQEEKGKVISKCPGQDTQFWGPDDIYSVECPTCGNSVEFFKDDIRRRCKKCGHMFLNPKLNLGCARWCQYADQCVGDMDREEFKEIIISGMKGFYGDDQKKIDQALELLRFAEEIMEQENGHPKAVIAAATLYGIGIDERREKAQSSEGVDKEKDKFPAVMGILERSGAKEEVSEEVCRILESHEHPGKADTLNNKIIHDAYQLARLEKGSEGKGKAEVKKSTHERFLTATAKKMAEAFGL
jgi:Zn ribbon nucleic-acid-binding protein